MKRTWLLVVASLFFAACALPTSTVKACNADGKPVAVAAADAAKQSRTNACRARYRECLKMKQIPGFECRTVYEDCINSII